MQYKPQRNIYILLDYNIPNRTAVASSRKSFKASCKQSRRQRLADCPGMLMLVRETAGSLSRYYLEGKAGLCCFVVL